MCCNKLQYNTTVMVWYTLHSMLILKWVNGVHDYVGRREKVIRINIIIRINIVKDSGWINSVKYSRYLIHCPHFDEPFFFKVPEEKYIMTRSPIFLYYNWIRICSKKLLHLESLGRFSEKYLLDFPKSQYFRGLKKTEKELLFLPFVNPRMTLVAPPALHGPSVGTEDIKIKK